MNTQTAKPQPAFPRIQEDMVARLSAKAAELTIPPQPLPATTH